MKNEDLCEGMVVRRVGTDKTGIITKLNFWRNEIDIHWDDDGDDCDSYYWLSQQGKIFEIFEPQDEWIDCFVVKL